MVRPIVSSVTSSAASASPETGPQTGPGPGFQAPKGYFGVGAETITKTGNLGNLIRSANAFGAAFVFTVNSDIKKRDLYRIDTSKSFDALPFYSFGSVESVLLPEKTVRVGVELTDDAIELPSFRHPLRAAYLFGPERGSLSPKLTATCGFIVKIPTRFCINIATAAAVVFYDRHLSLGRFAERAVSTGGPEAKPARHVQGGPVLRLERRKAALHGKTKVRETKIRQTTTKQDKTAQD